MDFNSIGLDSAIDCNGDVIKTGGIVFHPGGSSDPACFRVAKILPCIWNDKDDPIIVMYGYVNGQVTFFTSNSKRCEAGADTEGHST